MLLELAPSRTQMAAHHDRNMAAWHAAAAVTVMSLSQQAIFQPSKNDFEHN
jgi:hypothetical protein